MRTPISLVSLAAAAVGLAGLAATGSTASAQADDSAVAALAQHPGIARAADGQGFVERGTIVDADGTTHIRLDRTSTGSASSAATSSSTRPRRRLDRTPARRSRRR